MHADAEDLAALALDPTAVAPGTREHVSSCTACRTTSDELRAVAAGLSAAASEGRLVAPPAGLRDRVLDELAVDTDPGPTQRADVVPLRPRSRSHGRAVPVWAAGLAAAATLVVGLGLGRVSAPTEAPPGRPVVSGSVVAAADLTTVEGGDPRGLAEALRGGDDDVVTLHVDAEALGDDGGIHEVWLLNVDGERMVALGLLAAGDEGEFDVPVGLIERGYRVVDISVEPVDGDPTHSGVSLARGELT